MNLHLILVILAVFALLFAIGALIGERFPWSLRAAVILLAVVVLFSLVTGGCASQERNGNSILIPLRDNPKKPWPSCLYRFTVDGEVLKYGEIESCPEVPLCREPPTQSLEGPNT